MKILHSAVLALGLFVSAAACAQAPAGSTGQCKDGTYTTNDTKKGACSGHKGVKEWYGDKSGASAKTATAAPAAAPPAAATPAPAAPAAAAKTESAAAKPAATKNASAAPAPGGGAGKVWVNTETHVYHCAGTRWYGKTKQGEYMTESAAKAAGNHGDHGKACAG